MALDVTWRGSGDGLGLPRVPLGFVPAPGVSQILSALPPIVVFRAPRGFGKTSTASYWLRRADAPDHDRIWVNVPNRPIDREEFWTLSTGGCRTPASVTSRAPTPGTTSSTACTAADVTS